MKNAETARLVIQCEDRPGIVRTVSNFLFDLGANIITLDQYSTDPTSGKFFLRLEFQQTNFKSQLPKIQDRFAETVANRFQMQWHLYPLDQFKQAVILVSKHDHALLELLWQVERGELGMCINKIISNHRDLEEKAKHFNIPFAYVPVLPKQKKAAEERIQQLVEPETDLIILARYMQILSGNFVQRYPQKIINIHHSFLPAFVGANPYQQAHDRGVKIIGATAHYVTEDLDAGPIIAQDVEHVSHRDSVEDLKRKGRNIERNVLSKAVKWHLEDRVFVHDNATLVFN